MHSIIISQKLLTDDDAVHRNVSSTVIVRSKSFPPVSLLQTQLWGWYQQGRSAHSLGWLNLPKWLKHLDWVKHCLRQLLDYKITLHPVQIYWALPEMERFITDRVGPVVQAVRKYFWSERFAGSIPKFSGVHTAGPCKKTVFAGLATNVK